MKVRKGRQVMKVRKGRQAMKVRKGRQVRKDRKGKTKRDKSWVIKKRDSNWGRSLESQNICHYRFWSVFAILGSKGFCDSRGTPPAGPPREGRPKTLQLQ